MAPPAKKKRATPAKIKLTSVVWQGYFEKMDNGMAKCTKCDTELATPDGSTSNLLAHYSSFHAEDYAEMLRLDQEKKKKKGEDREIVQVAVAEHESSGFRTRSATKRSLVLTGAKSPNTSDELPPEQKYPLHDKKQLALDLWLTQFFTETGLSFELAETEAFRDLFLKMMPKVTVLNEVDFVRAKLPRLYDGMVTELEVKAYNGIRSNPSVANCSICFWVDKEKNTYLCFFVHYIDRQWLPHTILLKFQCLASDPIDTFIKELGNMLKSDLFNYRKVRAVYDKTGELVMKSAVNKFNFSTGFNTFHCIRARFAAIFEGMFEADPDMKRILDKVVEFGNSCKNEPFVWELIVGRIKSGKEAEVNDKLQKLDKNPRLVFEELDLLNPKECVDFMVCAKEILTELEKNTPMGYRPLTEEEWELLVPCQRLLMWYDVHRVQILQQQIPTCHVVSVVYIIKDHINKWLDAKNRDPRPAAVAKKFLLLLDEFFENSGAEDRLLCLANMLHPFYKGHMLKLVNAYERTVEDLVDSHPSTVEWGAEQARLLQIELEGRDEIDRYVIEEARKASSKSVSPIAAELEMFGQMPMPDDFRQVNLFSWWKKHKAKLPKLSEVAREVFSMPGLMPEAGFLKTAGDVEATHMVNYCYYNWDETEYHAWDLNHELLELKKPGITKKALETALAEIEDDEHSPPPTASGSGKMNVDDDDDGGNKDKGPREKEAGEEREGDNPPQP